MDLTEKQWGLIQPLLPKPKPSKTGAGRPRVDDRDILNGILWILRTGAPWADLPGRYPPYQTCHRRFQEWSKDGTFERIRHTLLVGLTAAGKVKPDEAPIDATFRAAKKGGRASVPPSAARAARSWQWSTAAAFLWESPSTAPRPPKSGSSTKRSKRSPKKSGG